MNDQAADTLEDNLEISAVIYDQRGDAYTVNGYLSQSSFIGYVYSKRRGVGRIGWNTSSTGVMIIGDLIIFESPLPRPWWSRWFPFFQHSSPRYKGRGLGSAMLNYVIESARGDGDG